jgi:uncharacterized membrane protein YhaH (DUF805 family)
MKCPTCGRDNPENAQFCGICGANLISGEAYLGAELPMVGFGEAISRGFSNYFTFSGRATRAENWWRALFAALLGLIPFCGLVTLIPSWALGARRLHDINRTGWWLLLWFVPVIGWIVLIVWAIERGDEGPNKYGPDPRHLPTRP